MLDDKLLREFAGRGYLVLRQAVPQEIVAAASEHIDGLVEQAPPDASVRGPYNYFPESEEAPPLLALLMAGGVFEMAEGLAGPGTLEVPWQIQVALNIPPFPHIPGLPHIDGAPAEPDGRPGTFTMLVGVLMSDQEEKDSGNLWVWPGTHLLHAEYFREKGPDAFFKAAGYPPIQQPEPEQVLGRAGDVVLAHYLLGHNIGGNVSPATRRAVYFRVKKQGHDPRWREYLQYPWLDYDPVRDLAHGPK